MLVWCKKCWLKHEEKDNSTEDESCEMNEDEMKHPNNPNSDVIEKIFEMMEKFTKRIISIEQKI